jgi:hypothetical protein
MVLMRSGRWNFFDAILESHMCFSIFLLMPSFSGAMFSYICMYIHVCLSTYVYPCRCVHVWISICAHIYRCVLTLYLLCHQTHTHTCGMWIYVGTHTHILGRHSEDVVS